MFGLRHPITWDPVAYKETFVVMCKRAVFFQEKSINDTDSEEGFFNLGWEFDASGVLVEKWPMEVFFHKTVNYSQIPGCWE